jgi:predicted HicB family RNase H-like nuclease
MAKQKDRLIRKIPADVDTILRVEAARQDISVNDLVLQILTKEAKRLEKKGRG